MSISVNRDRVGRLILALLGALAVAAGALGILGLRTTGSRLTTVAVGLAAIVNGMHVVRIARGKEAERERHNAST